MPEMEKNAMNHRIASIRRELEQAYAQGDRLRAQKLSRKIDGYQLLILKSDEKEARFSRHFSF